jgi:pantoate--beta-alanine ligase
MKLITSIKDMQQTVVNEKKSGKTVGLVPTMGFLHEGHLHLIREAKRENDFVVLSIFINPLQFGPNEDFDNYPKDMARDEQKARDEGVDVIFSPSKEEMYPDDSTVTVSVQKRADVLCGKTRPGHFDGVATVLTKLFHMTMPDRTYFGMKDAQQVAVVQGMIDDFNFPITLIPCMTVREEDGLAKSSRNVNLLPEEREQAPAIYESLLLGKQRLESGEEDSQRVVNAVTAFLKEKAPGGEIEYVEILSFPELNQIDEKKGQLMIAVAVQFQAARLIDNVISVV